MDWIIITVACIITALVVIGTYLTRSENKKLKERCLELKEENYRLKEKINHLRWLNSGLLANRLTQEEKDEIIRD